MARWGAQWKKEVASGAFATMWLGFPEFQQKVIDSAQRARLRWTAVGIVGKQAGPREVEAEAELALGTQSALTLEPSAVGGPGTSRRCWLQSRREERPSRNPASRTQERWGECTPSGGGEVHPEIGTRLLPNLLLPDPRLLSRFQ